MKRVWITYHMIRGEVVAKAAISLPMLDTFAEDLLEKQRKSRVLGGDRYNKGLLSTTLDRMAKLQGYAFAEFARAEEDV